MTQATTWRVLRQLRHDPRTIALLLLVPCVLMGLFRWLFDDAPDSFQHIGVPLLGIFPLVSMFLVSSITMLRERRSGTLERLMSMPLHKLDLIAGYAVAFGAVAVVQAGLVCLVSTLGLGLDLHDNAPGIVGLAVLNAVLGMALGLFVSAFANTEFQAVQFFPALVIPQLVLCGILGPRDLMAAPLQWLSDAFPLTYAYDSLTRLAGGGAFTSSVVADVLIVGAYSLGALLIGSATLQRRTA
ncbi:MAG: ABC transporter permease [Candidatus Dormibacteraeota bacterium]|nr:ABC transporter permease [Candidatus Dormibacteraeota bacterium]